MEVIEILIPFPLFKNPWIPAVRESAPSLGHQFRAYALCCRILGFSGSLDGKESAHSLGNPDSIPGSGRYPGVGNGNPFQYAYLENSVNGRTLPQLCKVLTPSWCHNYVCKRPFYCSISQLLHSDGEQGKIRKIHEQESTSLALKWVHWAAATLHWIPWQWTKHPA